MSEQTQVAVFGGGCFWCTEAVFAGLKGVISVMPGYTGGHVKNPSYQAVCSGITGHAEVSKIEFDPNKITYTDLLTVFFATHDPTTLNRQGADVGTQYRSAILFASEAQKQEAEKFIAEIDGKGQGNKIVTEVTPAGEFYAADESHRQYYLRNTEQAYCQLVISPKLEKLQVKYAELLKKK